MRRGRSLWIGPGFLPSTFGVSLSFHEHVTQALRKERVFWVPSMPTDNENVVSFCSKML